MGEENRGTTYKVVFEPDAFVEVQLADTDRRREQRVVDHPERRACGVGYAGCAVARDRPSLSGRHKKSQLNAYQKDIHTYPRIYANPWLFVSAISGSNNVRFPRTAALDMNETSGKSPPWQKAAEYRCWDTLGESHDSV